ncbi:MAG: serine hydrolase domain-containing protein [Myxococcota bacterium]
MKHPILTTCALVFALWAMACVHPHTPAITHPIANPPPEPGPGAATLTEGEVRLLVQPLLASRVASGVVVGVVDDRGQRSWGYGVNPFGGAMDGSTIFELGSLSKLFTALLLAQLDHEGSLHLDDSLSAHLEATHLTDALKLSHLATHSSGLPTTPPNGTSERYEGRHLEALLATYTLPGQPGKAFIYNNFAFGVLGYTLSHHTQTPFEMLVDQRICAPLQMRQTGVRPRLDPTLELNRSNALSDRRRERVDLGASGLRSTVDDMLKFLAAHADRPKGARTEAMTLVQTPRGPSWQGNRVGLGWHISETDGYVWHQGALGVYRSYVGIDPTHRTAVVVWSSPRTSYVDHVGIAILHRLAGRPLYIPTIAPEDWRESMTQEAH